MEELIVKYLSDNLSPTEQQTLETWLQVPENQAIFKTYLENDWLMRRSLLVAEATRVAKPTRSWYRWAAAACVALLGLVAWWWFTLTPAASTNLADLKPVNLPIEVVSAKGGTPVETDFVDMESLNAFRVQVPIGKRTRVKLPDGSLVTLNGGSELSLADNFATASKRMVKLSGDGFFEVAKNAARPFEVTANQLTVSVLGTKFTVTHFSGNKQRVVLLEGKVALKKGGRELIMKPNERVMVQDTRPLEAEQVTAETYKAWTQNRLVFRDAPFDEILQQLERHYGVRIVNTNATLGRQIFNASFNNQPLQQIIGYFKEATPMTYEIRDNILYIK